MRGGVNGGLSRLIGVAAGMALVIGCLAVVPALAGRDVGGRTIPESLLMPKPASMPASGPVVAPEPENLLPELARLVDREGSVVQKAVGPQGGMRTVFRSSDERLELVLLENRYLEALEGATDFGRKGVRVRVSGTVYVYRGLNYLLLNRVQIMQP